MPQASWAGGRRLSSRRPGTDAACPGIVRPLSGDNRPRALRYAAGFVIPWETQNGTKGRDA
ncbi:hypothetical protein Ga0080574_TMP1795 [Salipiger abyssi]|uniref:Uncharacterized protein n=1 Tax=Salipiger abyssi TaxID=1250539 RepID=A0A1P8URU7_9RHOB|nr:hypothetical protein Ga0080574_TMP1795 [Salipiger abyssi]